MYDYLGGYDDTIRLWDTRTWKRPLSEKFLKGGVWRTRFTKNGKHILVPCMYENAKILELSDNQGANSASLSMYS